MSGTKRILGAMTVAISTAAIVTAVPARADDPVTYTLEPYDGDGVFGQVHTLTQLQLGGTMCRPLCKKIQYQADNAHEADAMAAISRVQFKAGDTLMGFSLGTQYAENWLATHQLPAGVNVILVGDTQARNAELRSQGAGMPLDINNDVTAIANAGDGFSDTPTKTSSPGWWLAEQNAISGTMQLHNYANARLDNPNNTRIVTGRITWEIVPTQKLPVNDWLRYMGMTAQADAQDAADRALIDSAYDRPAPTPEQLAGAASEQVGVPPAPFTETPEPVA